VELCSTGGFCMGKLVGKARAGFTGARTTARARPAYGCDRHMPGSATNVFRLSIPGGTLDPT